MAFQPLNIQTCHKFPETKLTKVCSCGQILKSIVPCNFLEIGLYEICTNFGIFISLFKKPEKHSRSSVPCWLACILNFKWFTALWICLNWKYIPKLLESSIIEHLLFSFIHQFSQRYHHCKENWDSWPSTLHNEQKFKRCTFQNIPLPLTILGSYRFREIETTHLFFIWGKGLPNLAFNEHLDWIFQNNLRMMCSKNTFLKSMNKDSIQHIKRQRKSSQQ